MTPRLRLLLIALSTLVPAVLAVALAVTHLDAYAAGIASAILAVALAATWWLGHGALAGAGSPRGPARPAVPATPPGPLREAPPRDTPPRARGSEQRSPLSQRNAALGRLTGGVAHDFNNLLGVVSNSAHLMRRMNTDANLEEPIATTLRAVDTGSRLIEQLMRFAGRQALHPQTVDLHHHLVEAQVLMKAVLGQRVTVSVEVAPGTRSVRVDVSELDLALINLSLNALDAMPDGGSLWLQACNADRDDSLELGPGPFVLLSVTDDGQGLEEASAERVFEPFFTTKAVGRGAGLGLSQVHGFCVQAGGMARFASTPGLGSTVTLALPGIDPAVPVERESPPSLPAARPLAARLLLVEDNDELRQITAALLGAEGWTVDMARNADEALERIDAGDPCDVVLTDIVMPGETDGLALARTLRSRRPDLPIVLISAYSTSITAAVADFTVLRKPCAPDVLLDALRRAVDRRPMGMHDDTG